MEEKEKKALEKQRRREEWEKRKAEEDKKQEEEVVQSKPSNSVFKAQYYVLLDMIIGGAKEIVEEGKTVHKGNGWKSHTLIYKCHDSFSVFHSRVCMLPSVGVSWDSFVSCAPSVCV